MKNIVAKRGWTAEDIAKLKTMVAAGATAVRVSLALKRPIKAVKLRAKEEGVPFPSDRVVKKTMREIAYR